MRQPSAFQSPAQAALTGLSSWLPCLNECLERYRDCSVPGALVNIAEVVQLEARSDRPLSINLVRRQYAEEH